MKDFIVLYNSDYDFKNFIDELMNTNSNLWNEYKILKTYEIISSEIIDTSKYILDDSVIDIMISYFENNEQYEHCKFLNTLKKKI